MIVQSKFKPAWWLSNAHLQTLWPALVRRKISLALRRERVELPDGDFIDLDWIENANPDGPIVLLLHGLEGSIESGYIRGLMRALQQQGFRAVLMHFRGCSGEHNRFLHAYHSGKTDDLASVINLFQRREPYVSLYAVGFSLGGNVLLKWLGETQENSPLKKAVAVSVPFNLDKVAKKLSQGFSRIYQNHLVKLLCTKFISKHAIFRSIYNIDELKKIKTFWEFDDKVTAPLHGFNSALDYYQQSSSRQYLIHIKKPVLVIHAQDDPFMTPDVIPNTDELSASVTLELSNSGGHLGFVKGVIPGKCAYWLEERIPQFLQAHEANRA